MVRDSQLVTWICSFINYINPTYLADSDSCLGPCIQDGLCPAGYRCLDGQCCAAQPPPMGNGTICLLLHCSSSANIF